MHCVENLFCVVLGVRAHQFQEAKGPETESIMHGLPPGTNNQELAGLRKLTSIHYFPFQMCGECLPREYGRNYKTHRRFLTGAPG
jgi:hypothetical protein